MNLNAALTRLAQNPAAPFDLAEIALLLARDEYPDLDVDGYLAELKAMAHEVRRGLQGGLDQRVERLCRYLYHDLGFRGNTTVYYDPRNSYLNDVLDRRTGLPIALSAVAMAVGQRAGLDVVGVGLPGHFIVKVQSGQQEVLFDPFHGGRRLTSEECGLLIEQVTGSPFEVTPEALQPTVLGSIVIRMLNNLKGSYLRDKDFIRAARVIRRLRQICPDDWLQQRDLGATLLQAGRPGQAIGPLTDYLDGVPNAEDTEAVRRLLLQARDQVSKWN